MFLNNINKPTISINDILITPHDVFDINYCFKTYSTESEITLNFECNTNNTILLYNYILSKIYDDHKLENFIIYFNEYKFVVHEGYINTFNYIMDTNTINLCIHYFGVSVLEYSISEIRAKKLKNIFGDTI